MNTKVFRVVCLLAILPILLAVVGCRQGAEIGELQTTSEAVELGDGGSVKVEIDLAAGELVVSGGATDLLEANFNYNVAEMEPEIVYGGDELTVTHPEVTVVGSLADRNDFRNQWNLRFNDDIPMEMNIDVAAGSSDLTLGSLALTSLDMKAGAGDVTVDLTGSPSLSQFDFEMGAGALLMDLTGDWTDDLNANITAGVGELTLRLPSSVGVRVDVTEGIGKVNATNLIKEGDAYINDVYGESEVTLNFDIEAGVGTINLEAERAPAAAEAAPAPAEPAEEEEAQEEEVAVFDEDIAAQLQAVLEAAVASPDTNYPGAVLHVSSPEMGGWTGAAGLGEVESNTAMRPHDRFRAGSLTKPFISVVILQLVEEGLFSLDDPMTSVLPEGITGKFANSDQISVRMLLNHTGGLPDFMNLAGPDILADMDKVWQEEEFLDFAAAQEPLFAPGEAQGYSNTDYTLLGMIIEQATGHSWREEMRQRIFEPLNMENTLLPEPDDATLPGDHAHGCADFGEGLFDATELVGASVVGAAGGQSLITNAEDLSRFVTAVAAGELFQEAGTMGEMLTFVDWPDGNPLSPYVAGYGLGLIQAPFGNGIEGIGHSGDTAGGYHSFVFFLPAQGMTISGAVNIDDFSAGYLLIPRALEVLVPGFSAPVVEAEQPTAAGNVYEDPEGRFSITLVGDWTPVETDGTYVQVAYADAPLILSLVTVETDDLLPGVDAALRQVGLDPAALTHTIRTSWDKWDVLSYTTGDGQGVTVLGQTSDGTSYYYVVTGPEDLVANPPEDGLETIQGFSLSGEVSLPSSVEEFETYVNSFVGTMPPGLSMAIALEDSVLYEQGFGMADGPLEIPATPETVYQWASVTKTVTAAAIMQLREQGLIDLDAPVSDYLDYFPAEFPITVRHLLTHSSGLPEPADFLLLYLRLKGQPSPDFDAMDREYYEGVSNLMFEPGSQSAYVNPDYVTLGQVIAAVSGQPYDEYVLEHILNPLGMMNTEFSYSNDFMQTNAAGSAVSKAEAEATIALMDEARGLGDGADFFREIGENTAWLNPYIVGDGAGGALLGPVTEMIRFGQMMLNEGELDGVRILEPESVALLQEVQSSTSGEPLGIGLAWHFGEDAEHPYIQHDGGGTFQTKLRLYMKDGFAVAIMANGSGFDRNELADAAANVVFSMMGQ